ncbi:hypothetical protein ACJX0J_011639 [Zea mays]
MPLTQALSACDCCAVLIRVRRVDDWFLKGFPSQIPEAVPDKIDVRDYIFDNPRMHRQTMHRKKQSGVVHTTKAKREGQITGVSESPIIYDKEDIFFANGIFRRWHTLITLPREIGQDQKNVAIMRDSYGKICVLFRGTYCPLGVSTVVNHVPCLFFIHYGFFNHLCLFGAIKLSLMTKGFVVVVKISETDVILDTFLNLLYTKKTTGSINS